MSARRLPRELGVVIACDIDGCRATLTTALIKIRANRAWALAQGWLRDRFPRALFDLEAAAKSKGPLVKRDVCPRHAAMAKEALQQRKMQRDAVRAARDAQRKAKAAEAAS